MNFAEKEQMTGELAERFKGAELAVVVSYQGCTCAELTGLRKKLKPVGGKFAVIKNNLARRALAGTSAEKLSDVFVGPIGIIWSGEDPIGPAKVARDFAKEVEKFTIKAGVLGDSVMDAKEVESLASMPSREQLLAKLLGLINAPATRLLQTMNAPATEFVRLLGAWRSELEKKQ